MKSFKKIQRGMFLRNILLFILVFNLLNSGSVYGMSLSSQLQNQENTKSISNLSEEELRNEVLNSYLNEKFVIDAETGNNVIIVEKEKGFFVIETVLIGDGEIKSADQILLPKDLQFSWKFAAGVIVGGAIAGPAGAIIATLAITFFHNHALH